MNTSNLLEDSSGFHVCRAQILHEAVTSNSQVLANVAISELLDEYRYTPEAKAFHEDFAKQLFPVSIDWEPPFAMLVPIKKHGDRLVSDCLCHVLLTLPNTQQSPTLDCKIAAKMDQTSVLRATQITTLHKAVAL